MSSLVLHGVDKCAIAVDPTFTAQKRLAIEEAQLCQSVNDPFTQAAATESLRALARIQKQVEDDRQRIKQPVLQIGRQIDATAQGFVADVATEINRLKSLLSSYEIEQRRKADEERRRQEEAQRQAQEAERRRLAEIERQRRDAEEAARKAEQAATPQEATKALQGDAEEAARKAEQAATPQEATKALQAAVVAEEKAEALAAPVAQPVFVAPVVHRAEGSVVSERWTFDLVDIRALYAAHPELVQLTPKRAEILTLIRAGTREIPGLNIRKEINVGVRV